jgi:hypothetical protein
MAEWAAAGYLRNIDESALWRVRRLLGLALESLTVLKLGPTQDLARCAVLRTAQWALDMRSDVPSARELRAAITATTEAMVEAASTYAGAVTQADAAYPNPAYGRTTILEHGLPGLAEQIAGRFPAPRLVLTSPPYPGVYVNYHRWKVRGRRETPALFWIADRRDGNGLSHYTMSARAEPTLDVYFSHLGNAFADLALLCDEGTTVVQIVGFHDPERDLPRYLEALAAQGFSEVRLQALATRDDGRLWREVPNRRWWAQAQARVAIAPHTAQEIVLVHRVTP